MSLDVSSLQNTSKSFALLPISISEWLELVVFCVSPTDP